MTIAFLFIAAATAAIVVRAHRAKGDRRRADYRRKAQERARRRRTEYLF